MHATAALFLAAAVAAAPEGAAPTRRVVDRVVAIIERQPLLLSELDFEARVALIQQGGVQASSAKLTDEELARTLDYVIGQRLAHAEAERLDVFAVDDAELGQAIQAFAGRFANEREYREFLSVSEAGEDQLAAILRRDLRVARYIESRIKLAARVSDEDLQRFYREHAADFSGQSFGQVREGLRSALLRERYRELARKQLAELRARSDVRMVASFATGQPAGAPGGAPQGESR